MVFLKRAREWDLGMCICLLAPFYPGFRDRLWTLGGGGGGEGSGAGDRAQTSVRLRKSNPRTGDGSTKGAPSGSGKVFDQRPPHGGWRLALVAVNGGRWLAIGSS